MFDVPSLGQVANELLLECRDDYVGLWEFPWAIREEFHTDDADLVMRLSLEVIREMLGSGLMEVGFLDLSREKFVPWNLSPEEALEKIRREWIELKREPDILEIAWFDITERGKEKLSDLCRSSREITDGQ